eukprot:3745039-Alexandrium_andersonii.AAC.1
MGLQTCSTSHQCVRMRWALAKHTAHAKTAKASAETVSTRLHARTTRKTQARNARNQRSEQGDIWPHSQRVIHRSSMLASTAPHNDSKQAS